MRGGAENKAGWPSRDCPFEVAMGLVYGARAARTVELDAQQCPPSFDDYKRCTSRRRCFVVPPPLGFEFGVAPWSQGGGTTRTAAVKTDVGWGHCLGPRDVTRPAGFAYLIQGHSTG